MCDRCGDPNHTEVAKVGGTFQTLGLKALSLYETQYITQRAFFGTFSLAGNASGDVGSAPIVQPGIFPRQLHQQPGASVNAYALVKDPVVIVRVNTPGATIPTFAGVLYYRDYSGADHLLGGFDMRAASATVVNLIALSNATIVVPPTPFTSAMPSDLGRLVVNGAFTIGTAVGVAFDLYCNIGFLYGVPR
jgi:hypothetical protein